MSRSVIVSFFFLVSSWLPAQERQTKNLIIVTLDGLRWQEVFSGADEAILFNEKFVRDRSVGDLFWDASAEERRKKLLPFFWNEISTRGQLYGNRKYHNNVNCKNMRYFSYPGYSELLVGFVDKRVKSNDKIVNPNYTVLEFIHEHPDYNGKVAAFSTWEVIPYIIRATTADIYANGGNAPAEGDQLSEVEAALNDLQKLVPNPHGARFDAFTFYYAFEYLKREQPRVMFISFDETDQHGHGGRYDDYLKAAHRADEMIGKLWEWVQTTDGYKDQTTLLITTDHGRGKNARKGWKDHGLLQFGSGQVWWAVIGPDTPPAGEMKTKAHYTQSQLAKTAAAFLGLEYINVEPVGEVVKTMLHEKIFATHAPASSPGEAIRNR